MIKDYHVLVVNYAGRLTYVNYVIASMPIFSMCSFKVHITILGHVNKSSRYFYGMVMISTRRAFALPVGKCYANPKIKEAWGD